MKYMNRKYYAAFFLVIFVCLGSSANASLMAKISFLETQNNGLWYYDYTYTNATDPSDANAFSLFEVHLLLSPTATLKQMVVPEGWDGWLVAAAAGNSVQADDPYILTFSILDDNPADILPGESLGGFQFQFEQPVGALPFIAYFWDPAGGDPPFVEGTTVPIPLPATILLAASGVVALGILKRKNTASPISGKTH